MPITLGSNIASLRGQLALGKVSQELRTTYERLSSGQRINRAADDAAGLSVASNLNADSRIYAQGVRNLNDGISLLNIADSAVESLSGIVIRIQELAEQAANGVYSGRQRSALDQEAQSLKAEFARIQQSTTFNGRNLLDGSVASLQLQAGSGLDAVLNLGVGGEIGTGGFTSSKTLDTNDLILALASADFNGDGIMDLVSTNDSLVKGFSVSLGRGDGTFGAVTEYFSASTMTSLVTADFNGDGIMDLAGGGSSGVQVVYGNGDGTFGAISNITNFAVSDLTTGDYNGDGRADFAVAEGATVKIYSGAGNKTFTNTSSFTQSETIVSLTSGDVNNDGVTDLVGAAHSIAANNVYVNLGNGNSTFGATQSHSTGAGSSMSVIIADFNGDGKNDIAVGNRNDMTVNVLNNTGNGVFSGAQSYAVSGRSSSLLAADVNGDGYADLVVGSNASLNGTIDVLLNKKDGTFLSAESYDGRGGGSVEGIVAIDTDNNGVQELVTGGDVSKFVFFSSISTTGTSAIHDFSLRSVAEAKQALSMLKVKSQLLSKQRGEIGAYQSRIEVANNVLAVARENFIAAESRIKDADFASESSQLARLSILQRSASAVLAQANLQPELAIKLLK